MVQDQRNGGLSLRPFEVPMDHLRIIAGTPVTVQFFRNGSQEIDLWLTAMVAAHVGRRIALSLPQTGGRPSGPLDAYTAQIVAQDPRLGRIVLKARAVAVHDPLLWLEAFPKVVCERTPRVAFGEAVLLGLATASMPCLALDLSLEGIGVRLPLEHRLYGEVVTGLSCRVRFTKEGPPLDEIVAEVVWRDEDRAGLRFAGLTAHEERALLSYMAQVAWWRSRIQAQLGIRSHAAV